MAGMTGVRMAGSIAALMLTIGVAAGMAKHHHDRYKTPAEGETGRHPYRKHWKQSIVGKKAVARVTAGAAIDQAMDSPSKYGTGAGGFAKRMGTGFASNAVGRTVEHGLAARLHEDLHYTRSGKHGFGPRLRYALKSTVITRNTKTGRTTPAAGRIAGHAASGAFTQGVLAAGSGATTAGVGLAADAGANVFREFGPHHKHSHKAKG